MKTNIGDSLNDLRGKMGKWVYRFVDGQMVVARRPVGPRPPPTPAQVQHLARFRRASLYAKAVFAEPARKAVYAAKAKALGRSTVWAMIMGDCLNLPTVTEMDISGYDGHVGNRVQVSAIDDFEVVAVKVTIRDANTGAVIESGNAQLGDFGWVYLATVEAPRDRDLTIEAEAFDRATNSRTLSKGWHAPAP